VSSRKLISGRHGASAEINNGTLGRLWSLDIACGRVCPDVILKLRIYLFDRSTCDKMSNVLGARITAELLRWFISLNLSRISWHQGTIDVSILSYAIRPLHPSLQIEYPHEQPHRVWPTCDSTKPRMNGKHTIVNLLRDSELIALDLLIRVLSPVVEDELALGHAHTAMFVTENRHGLALLVECDDVRGSSADLA
jgi:hypothetical protein